MPSRAAQLATRRNTSTFAYARLCVRRPRLLIALGVLVPVLCGAILYGVGALTLADPSGNDYLIPGNDRVADGLALKAARDFVQSGGGDGDGNNSDNDLAARSLQSQSRTLFLMFNSNNMLTPENVARIRDAEIRLKALPEFVDHCFFNQAIVDACTGEVPVCSPVLSISSVFYPKCEDRNSSRLLSQQEFDAALDTVRLDGGAGFAPDFAELLGNSATAEPVSSQFVRSIFTFGRPVEGYDSIDDKRAEQKEKYDLFASDFADLAQGLSDDDRVEGGLTVLVFGESYANYVFGIIALKDFGWALASMMFVYAYICFHTGSVYLGSMGIAQILLAFPFAWFFYRFLAQVRYFASLHILSIFLILGIGADDIFVFTDAWQQAGVVLGEDCPLTVRMSWAYRRAAKAMLVTSFTTSMAFFVTALSPIMPISTFGVWAAFLIIFQYVLCITLYPANLIVWHRHWRFKSLWVKCGACTAPDVLGPDEPVEEPEPSEEEAIAVTPAKVVPQQTMESSYETESPISTTKEPSPLGAEETPEAKSDEEEEIDRDSDSSDDEGEDSGVDYRRMERFFRGFWTNTVFRMRYPLTLAAIILFCLACWQASNLAPLSEDEVWIPETIDIRKGAVWLGDEFPVTEGSNQLQVDVTYGVEGLDRSDADRYNPEDIGSPVFDSSFSLQRAVDQDYLVTVCEKILADGKLNITDSAAPASCFINDFKQYKNGSFVDYSSERELVADLTSFANFELADGSVPYRRYIDLGQLGIQGDDLHFVVLSFKTTTRTTLPYSKMNPVVLEWTDAIDKLNAKAPGGVNAAYPTAGYPWSWGVTQNTLVRSSIGGVAIALGVALAALVVSTLNIVIASLATLCIGGIVCCTLAAVHLFGWELGITESIAAVIIVGFSVDYVVHLGNAYVESKHKRRLRRTRDALTDMGISVLAGSITTIGSGIFLYGAVVIFFKKFATILVVTIGWSLFWSLGIFTALLLVIGPENQRGSLSPMVNWFKKRLFCCGTRALE